MNSNAKVYGFLWKKTNIGIKCDGWHFNHMQDVINEPIIRGKMGIDIGSGCGFDTYLMARDNPSVKIISMDISNGVYQTKEVTSRLNNVRIVRCSALNIPFKDNNFDFAYSFGVLHHIPEPKKGFLEMARILKINSPAFVYLYEDHYGNFLKHISIRIIMYLRIVTVRIPARLIYILTFVFSPLVFILFSFPSKFLAKFKNTRHVEKAMPFNFGKSFFSLHGDLYDRFSAPVEHRFNKQEVYNIFSECGFYNVNITKLNASAGWVAWGYKKQCLRTKI